MRQAGKGVRMVDPEHQEDPERETPGPGPDDLTGAGGIASWLVHEIGRGSLADSEIGVALLLNRTCEPVAHNAAYLDVAHAQQRTRVETMTRGVARQKADEDDLRAVCSVRSGDLGAHLGPHRLDDGTDAGGFLIFGIGERGAAPTYVEVCLYLPDRSGSRGTEGAGEHHVPALFGAMVDENWRLRVVPSVGAAPFFTDDDVSGSVLPTVHPADLPKLLALGTSVRSGALDLTTIPLNLRASDGTWILVDAALTQVSGDDSEPWLALHCSVPSPPRPGDQIETSSAGPVAAGPDEELATSETWEHLLLRTYPELSDREREIARAVLSGYRVKTIAEHLYLSSSTVRNHLSSLFHRIGVTSQAEFIERLHDLRNDHYPD